MLTKFETKSNRVKGLSFHPKHPWILASLHNGGIHLWDYRMGSLLEKFEEHNGPVRGICFHRTQPMFVSGGDDYKIKVWNYNQRRCLYTLYGHLDYIRTVQFHHTLPWVVSASDDQTVRIWNWQSRTCLAVLTGHNHYVMCAQFHPKDDLIVSASLDQTVRVWDFSGLRMRHTSLSNPDLFMNTDVVVKCVLEGHERGVNWASFHHSLPLVVSGGDDRVVKIWRVEERGHAWEVDTLRTHVNNVSCVIVHPKQELVISNSEDRTIRIWDLPKRQHTHTFRREHDRFWILAAHPEQNLLAAGHDTGLVIFKLERERPALAVDGPNLLYVKEKNLRLYELPTSKDGILFQIRKAVSLTQPAPRTIAYNPMEKLLLVSQDDPSPNHSSATTTYELYSLSGMKPVAGAAANAPNPPDSKKGTGSYPVWVSRNRFAVIDAKQQISVYGIDNVLVKTIAISGLTPVDALFPAPTGFVLVRSESRVCLVDVTQGHIVHEMNAGVVKYVVWQQDMSHVALISKHTITIVTRNLQQVCCLHETLRLKSAAFDERGVLIYNTLNHIKFCLPNGDTGIIQTVHDVLYITHARDSSIFVVDRNGNAKTMKVDSTEFVFKLALVQKKYDEVLRMIKTSNLCGQAIISYLQKKGYPEIALHFVTDDLTKFNFALECGNIDAAEASAAKLDKPDAWDRLAEAALRKGDVATTEKALLKTKNFEKLSFLYAVTGNFDKLRRMINIAEMKGDVLGRFQDALFVGDVEERIRVLMDVGHFSLAYLCAKTHGLEEKAREILTKPGVMLPEPLLAEAESRCKTSDLLLPPTPLMHGENWPLFAISSAFVLPKAAPSSSLAAAAAPVDETVGAAWGGDLDLDLDGVDTGISGAGAISGDALGGAGEEGAGWIEDADLDLPDLPAMGAGSLSGATFVPPTPGSSPEANWAQRSNLAGELAAAGAFEVAMQVLHNQVGVVNFTPLKPIFLQLFTGAHLAMPSLPLSPPMVLALPRDVKEETSRPAISLTLPSLVKRLSVAYELFSKGQFSAAYQHFVSISHSVPMLVVDTRQQSVEAKELLSSCREYITALRLELKRRELGEADPSRQLELAAYFTHCKLQPFHMQLALQNAMVLAYKLKNYQNASSFARRLLELTPQPAMAEKASKIIAACDKTPGNALTIKYDERNPFVTCASTFTPIYKGHPFVTCPFCGSFAHPQHKNEICQTCKISKIGLECSGLTVHPTPRS
eukprot:TRINITY_DN14929_c0_g1::TRINITY_DN14929_c0_g1_i1::g.25834::m.25834 TRINITY_DN14929_c0_g1::TRINITY_DN14929_c0_g1_i1::g.25834  ORF type:complete len:1225 (-),score=362.34,sp/Q9AUR7/COPA2_ORYSJ/51.00/0.0,COPI_C/PF06957.6/2.6e-120,Coatomer_WDAD/PF04053.9/1e-115,WD40/PF00400.27/0.56,WD40/PF00400.27/4.3e-08,WD40/PF00400.27/9.7e-10,WD40/PF00400.27/2.6e-11,WD40/PF00400.27/7.1e-08,WD40/PF00400.27/5.7e-07,WD40/PF00400.27/3.5e+03,Nup160/PF11715.3/1.8e+02,Nup160/PF11715.3/26,Nup160/PF11715.3/0.012,TPR_2/PF07